MLHDHNQHGWLEPLARMLLYLGSFALVGAGLYGRWIGQASTRLWGLLVLGALLVLVSSGLLVWHVVNNLGLPQGFWPMVGAYLSQTQQGNLLILRILMVLVLLLLGLRGFWPVHLLAVAGLGLSVSLTSHAAAKGGVWLYTDLAHLGITAVWGGLVLACAWNWPKETQPLQALERLSRAGIIAVVGFALSGIALSYGSLGWPPVVASDYGQRWLLKLVLVALVLGIAAANRWVWLPQMRRGQSQGLGWGLGLEGLALAGVLAASGWLATTPTPVVGVSMASPPLSINEPLGEQRLVGNLSPSTGTLHLLLQVQDLQLQPLNPQPPLLFSAIQGDRLIEQTLSASGTQHHHSITLSSGEWQIRLKLTNRTLEYPLYIP